VNDWIKNEGQFGHKGPDLDNVDIVLNGSMMEYGPASHYSVNPRDWDWSPQCGVEITHYRPGRFSGFTETP